jgi:5-methylcytosine-specific restriction protein A
MKMCNFLRVDPSYINKGLKGLKGGSQEDIKVWAEFSGDKARLQAVARVIRASAEIGGDEGVALQTMTSDENDEAPEGKVLTRLHKFRERNRDLVEKKKRKALEAHKCLVCEVCDFDFSDVYGDLGYGFIECHHTAPISQLQPGQKTRLTELALVCSNCHRMLHRGKRWMSVEELRSLLRDKRQESPIA